MSRLLEVTKQRIMQMADNMAAAATTFNSHGYDAFISARQEFIQYLNDVDEETMHDSSIGLGQRPFTS